MNVRASVSILGLVALLTTVEARAADGRPVLNSFVDRRVSNTSELLAHIRQDSVVADRYERHFAMDRASVLRYVGGLHRGTLSKTGFYTIYSVPRGGRLKMHVGRIRQGEPMFLDARGSPVLVVKCGNPVVLGPARATRANPIVASIAEAPNAVREFGDASEGPRASDVVALVPSDAPPILIAAVPGTVTQPTAPTVGASPGGRNLTILLPILTSIPVVRVPIQESHQAVPEPATVLALAAGLAVLARRKR